MSAIVVFLVAVAVMLVCAVAVAVARLATALRGLRDVVQSTQQWLEPVVAELNEGGQVATLEMAQLQASIADLRRGGSHDGRGGSEPPSDALGAVDRRSGDTAGYTA
jgi:predicted PurR-regulated permease PerM